MKSFIISLLLSLLLALPAGASQSIQKQARKLVQQIEKFEQKLPTSLLDTRVFEDEPKSPTYRDFYEIEKALIMINAVQMESLYSSGRVKTH